MAAERSTQRKATAAKREPAADPKPDPEPESESAPPPVPDGTPREGDYSEAVQHLQRQLNAAGAFLDVDGRWTAKVTRAVAAFQTRNGLDSTGELDAATLAALG